jgi:hypothetical protein
MTTSGPKADELMSVDQIIERCQRPGPHSTVIMQFPTPGEAGDDRLVRWHVRRSELVKAGADATTLALLDDAVDSLEPRGVTVLFTADETDAAYCWLIDHTVEPMTHVGACPALLPALDELTDRSPVIAAAVDHVGADLFELVHLDLTDVGSVKGEHIQTHRHTGGDQAGYQRRADAVYDRNADTIARRITEHAVHAGAHLVVLTGDDRETAAVTDHLDTHRFAVSTEPAGARHEAQLRDRVRHACIERSLTARRQRRADAVEHLRRELGQHALGVEGREATATAIAEARVATTFIDRASPPTDADELARDTILFGGTVVVTHGLDVVDGVAAIVRYTVAP